MMQEVGGSLDLSRTHFVGRIPYLAYVSLLQISRLHIYLTYPFVLSWSMLEAMACGAPVLASATPPVQEIIQDNKNGYLFDFFDQEQLISRAVTLSENPSEIIRTNARKYVEENFNFVAHSLPKYEKLMFEHTA
jgi:glycosyltransferase involved in cell wall biosynthesis